MKEYTIKKLTSVSSPVEDEDGNLADMEVIDNCEEIITLTAREILETIKDYQDLSDSIPNQRTWVLYSHDTDFRTGDEEETTFFNEDVPERLWVKILKMGKRERAMALAVKLIERN